MGGLPEDTPEDYREYYDYVKTEIVKEGVIHSGVGCTEIMFT